MDNDFAPRAPRESVPELKEERAHPAGPNPASSGLESDTPLEIERGKRPGDAYEGEFSWDRKSHASTLSRFHR